MCVETTVSLSGSCPAPKQCRPLVWNLDHRVLGYGFEFEAEVERIDPDVFPGSPRPYRPRSTPRMSFDRRPVALEVVTRRFRGQGVSAQELKAVHAFDPVRIWYWWQK